MNYRHAYHAGNFADVIKHVALVAALLHLRKKDSPFVAIDSHAGPGLYGLRQGPAAKTDEAASGIARLGGVSEGPEALLRYLELARREEGKYPGSPTLAAMLLRPQDRLVAVEKHPEEWAALRENLQPWRNARAVCGDGYAQLHVLLLPKERRGLVLIDPPYEAPDEFAQAARAFAESYRRFATGRFLIWYPVKSRAAADAFCGELMSANAATGLRLEFDIAPHESKEERLTVAGLVAINPPFGFAEEMGAAFDVLAPLLGRDAPAQYRIEAL